MWEDTYFLHNAIPGAGVQLRQTLDRRVLDVQSSSNDRTQLSIFMNGTQGPRHWDQISDIQLEN